MEVTCVYSDDDDVIIIDGFICGDCGYSASSENDLNQHNVSQHVFTAVFGFIEENNKKEELQTVKKCRSSRKILKPVNNINNKYPCNECDYQAKQRGNLQAHIRSKHEGIRYNCNQCDYQATTQGHLQSHIEAKHSNNILQCELCDYQTKWRSKYNQHKKVHITI